MCVSASFVVDTTLDSRLREHCGHLQALSAPLSELGVPDAVILEHVTDLYSTFTTELLKCVDTGSIM